MTVTAKNLNSCSVLTSKALMVDLCSDVLRIMDFEKIQLCVCSRLETFQALNDTSAFFTRNFATENLLRRKTAKRLKP